MNLPSATFATIPNNNSSSSLSNSSISSALAFHPFPEDDLIAGCTLILLSMAGILLHALEMCTMCRLVSKVIGFRFFLVLSCADIWLLLIFGTFPGWIILSKQPGFLTQWARPLHTWADTCWFSMCYMNVVIAGTRFACVVFPLHFRRLRRQSTCWLICLAVWLFAAIQSYLMNSAPWFVVLWYDPDTYGMNCDWAAYASSGTQSIYLALNGTVVGAYLLIYISTAVTIFFKRNIRSQFMSTVCCGGGGAANNNSSGSGDAKVACCSIKSQSPPPPAPNGQQQKQQRVNFVKNGLIKKSKSDNEINNNNCNDKQQHNKRGVGINGGKLFLMRTISVKVIKAGGGGGGGGAGGSNFILGWNGGGGGTSSQTTTTTIFGGPSSSYNYFLEVRLVIPCCVNSLIFVIAQLIITHGGLGTGKWAGFWTMMILCIQSIAPPILRFSFSELLRDEALVCIGWKRTMKKQLRILTTVVAAKHKHQQQQQQQPTMPQQPQATATTEMPNKTYSE